MKEQPFQRCDKNPILTRDAVPFRAVGIFNPGAAEEYGEVVLLVRIEGADGFSDIHVARSRNGVDDWRVSPDPLLRHGLPRWGYETWGCEDARVVWIEEDQCWYITYVAYSEMGPAVGIARTENFNTADRLCLLGATNDKDGALFPTRFNGDYLILHRPDAGGYQHIWSAWSSDLVRWGEPHCVLREGDGPAWDGEKVGVGPPPILTDHGWLLLYHGVKNYGGSLLYRVGMALLDTADPHKVLARTAGCVFEAEAPYEVAGTVPNVVFPSGAILRGDELWMYYGAADYCIGLATAKLDDLLALLDSN